MSKIHGNEVNIGKVFSEEYAFSIPPYQRPYSWSTEQASELFDDLINACNSFESVSEEPYFLGSIVLIKQENKPEAEVIDGQQRLTTLSLLLAVFLNTLPSEISNGMRKLLWESGNLVMGTKDRFRLKLRSRDNDFYENHILRSEDFSTLRSLSSTSLSDPQKRIRENLLYFEDKLNALSSEIQQRLAAYLVQNTFLVVVSTPDLDSAYRIFSVLNGRGMDLTVADILKAEIIGSIESAEREQYTLKWENAEELLGTAQFAELFSYIRFIYAKKKQKETVLKEFREHVTKHASPKILIDKTITPFSAALREIRSQSFSSASDAQIVNRYLRYLARLDESDWLGPAILFHSKSPSDACKLRLFYQDLERLASIMWILSYDVNQRIECYGRLIQAINNNENLNLPDSPLQLSSKQCANAVTILDGDIYNISRKSKRTMIMLRLDELISTGEATYQFPLITVEHVLPQSPPQGSQWIEWWPDESKRQQSVHRLGNLLLLNRQQNASAKNYDFERKKRSYFITQNGSSPFHLTTQVLNQTEWTPSVFEARQRELLQRLKDAWRLQ